MFLLVCLIAAAFFTSAQCQCEYTNGDYSLKWTYTAATQTVNFHMKHSSVNDGEWVGVAFGDGMGSGLDTILVEVSGGRVSVTDGYLRGYTYPRRDASNDVTLVRAQHNGRNLDVQFSRPLVTGDSQKDKSLANCQRFQHQTRGSPVGGKHRATPRSQYVCNIASCKEPIVPSVVVMRPGGSGKSPSPPPTPGTTPSTTTPPTTTPTTTTTRKQSSSNCPKEDLNWCWSYLDGQMSSGTDCSKITSYIRTYCCAKTAQLGC